MTFTAVLKSDELWTGEMRGLVVGEKRVLLLKVDTEVYAYEDRCAHLGFPLSQGILSNGVLTCSAHHFQYEARSGQGINPKSVRLVRFPVRVKDGSIWVDLSQPVVGGGP